jgi:hypothetical protein
MYSKKTWPDATLSTKNPTCQTRAATVGSQRLTASAVARPTANILVYINVGILTESYCNGSIEKSECRNVEN